MTKKIGKLQSDQFRSYDRERCVVFLKTKEQFGGLSNMAAGYPLTVNGFSIRTSEALYQACRFPHIPKVQQTVIDERSPMTAKMRTKPFRKDTRPDWDDVRVMIMRWCLRVKLAQNWREFGGLLEETGDRPIVEQSRKDDFWGAKAGDDGLLVGMNVLGRLLMELRQLQGNDEFGRLRSVKPLAIPEFLLFQRPIGVVGGVDTSSRLSEIENNSTKPVLPTSQSELLQPGLFDTSKKTQRLGNTKISSEADLGSGDESKS